MANDYGYFGSGSTGYAHYKQSFDRNFGGSGGSGGNHNGGGKAPAAGLCCLHCCCCSRCACAVGNVILNKRRMLPIKKRAIACGAVVLFFACFLFGLVVK